MDINFEDLLESGTKITTIILLALVLAVYLSGFVIVNAYLSKYHIRQVDLFQSAFISAGLLFGIINLIAAIVAIFPAYALTGLLVSGVPSYKLLLYTIATLGIVIFFEYLVGQLTSLMLGFASRGFDMKLFYQIVEPITLIVIVNGIAVFLISLCLWNINKLLPSFQALTFLLACVLFFFVETNSLLKFADDVYELIPVTAGGGQQQNVILLVDLENAKSMDSIDDNFEEDNLIIDSNLLVANMEIADSVQAGNYKSGTFRDANENANPGNTIDHTTGLTLIPTKPLTLFWQLSGASLSTNTVDRAYYIRPAGCGPCPVIQIPESSVYGIIFLEESEPNS